METKKINIPDKVADLARVEYSKAYLYASLFIHSYQLATDALLDCGAFNRDLIGSWFGERYEYKGSKMLTPMPQGLLARRIGRIQASGGWSNMDYCFR